MKCINKTIVLTTLLVAVGSADGQQPPDVMQSDGHVNTAMGTAVLSFVTYNGSANTEMGTGALAYTTDGSWNTAADGCPLVQWSIPH